MTLVYWLLVVFVTIIFTAVYLTVGAIILIPIALIAVIHIVWFINSKWGLRLIDPLVNYLDNLVEKPAGLCLIWYIVLPKLFLEWVIATVLRPLAHDGKDQDGNQDGRGDIPVDSPRDPRVPRTKVASPGMVRR